MYGLPEDFDGTFFIGRSVLMVGFSLGMTELIFDEDVSLGLFASYECSFADSENNIEYRRDESPITLSRLMQLIGCKVKSVDAERCGTLTLYFDKGHVFRCFDDTSGYESYDIGYKDKRIIV